MRINFRAFLFSGLILLTTCLGCNPDASTQEQAPVEDDDQDVVFQLLETMREDVFREAFRSLPARSFLRYERTEQRDGDYHLERMIERVLRHRPDAEGEVVTVIDSVGAFDGREAPGFLRGDGPPLADLHRHLLPNDPAYASRREAEAFEYTMAPDTTIWGQRMQVAIIQARPVIGDDQRIRNVRLYVHPETNQLLGITLQQLDHGLLFGENTTMDVRLRPAPEDEWVPYLIRVHTELRAAMLPIRVFRTVYTFYDFA